MDNVDKDTSFFIKFKIFYGKVYCFDKKMLEFKSCNNLQEFQILYKFFFHVVFLIFPNLI